MAVIRRDPEQMDRAELIREVHDWRQAADNWREAGRIADERGERARDQLRGAVSRAENAEALLVEYQRTMDQQAYRIAEQEAQIGNLLAGGQ